MYVGLDAGSGVVSAFPFMFAPAHVTSRIVNDSFSLGGNGQETERPFEVCCWVDSSQPRAGAKGGRKRVEPASFGSKGIKSVAELMSLAKSIYAGTGLRLSEFRFPAQLIDSTDYSEIAKAASGALTLSLCTDMGSVEMFCSQFLSSFGIPVKSWFDVCHRDSNDCRMDSKFVEAAIRLCLKSLSGPFSTKRFGKSLFESADTLSEALENGADPDNAAAWAIVDSCSCGIAEDRDLSPPTTKLETVELWRSAKCALKESPLRNEKMSRFFIVYDYGALLSKNWHSLLAAVRFRNVVARPGVGRLSQMQPIPSKPVTGKELAALTQNQYQVFAVLEMLLGSDCIRLALRQWLASNRILRRVAATKTMRMEPRLRLKIDDRVLLEGPNSTCRDGEAGIREISRLWCVSMATSGWIDDLVASVQDVSRPGPLATCGLACSHAECLAGKQSQQSFPEIEEDCPHAGVSVPRANSLWSTLMHTLRLKIVSNGHCTFSTNYSAAMLSDDPDIQRQAFLTFARRFQSVNSVRGRFASSNATVLRRFASDLDVLEQDVARKMIYALQRHNPDGLRPFLRLFHCSLFTTKFGPENTFAAMKRPNYPVGTAPTIRMRAVQQQVVKDFNGRATAVPTRDEAFFRRAPVVEGVPHFGNGEIPDEFYKSPVGCSKRAIGFMGAELFDFVKQKVRTFRSVGPGSLTSTFAAELVATSIAQGGHWGHTSELWRGEVAVCGVVLFDAEEGAFWYVICNCKWSAFAWPMAEIPEPRGQTEGKPNSVWGSPDRRLLALVIPGENSQRKPHFIPDLFLGNKWMAIQQLEDKIPPCVMGATISRMAGIGQRQCAFFPIGIATFGAAMDLGEYAVRHHIHQLTVATIRDMIHSKTGAMPPASGVYKKDIIKLCRQHYGVHADDGEHVGDYAHGIDVGGDVDDYLGDLAPDAFAAYPAVSKVAREILGSFPTAHLSDVFTPQERKEYKLDRLPLRSEPKDASGVLETAKRITERAAQTAAAPKHPIPGVKDGWVSFRSTPQDVQG